MDPDFYDHPKSINLSDAAVALWTRAGSYCASKLSDGWVPDAMLARLSSTSIEASAELVKCGLWRRAKGGHRFHQWDHRNITKERVETYKKADRERKRGSRDAGGANRNTAGHSTNPPNGIQPESTRNPNDSVFVSVSSLRSSEVGTSVTDLDARDPEHRVEDETRSKPVNVSAARLAKVYTSRVPLSDPGKISAVIWNAIGAGYSADVITRGLETLASEKRPVTADTLRIAIEGKSFAAPAVPVYKQVGS